MKIPKTWTPVSKESCQKLNCKYAYNKTVDNKVFSIIVYMVGDADERFFDTAKKGLDAIKEENLLVDGNPNDKNYENTAIVMPLVYGDIVINKERAFLNLSNYLVADNKYQTICQIMFNKDGKLYNIQFTTKDYNLSNAQEEFRKDPLFIEVLEYIRIN